jgi:thiol-disulfide isomerase/thioredoxin
MNNSVRYVLLIVALGAIVVAIVYLQSGRASPRLGTVERVSLGQDIEEKDRKYDTAVELVAPHEYINTEGNPITLSELIGKKVILIDFWTYSCINCQRTMPYLTAWYDAYKDDGLEIVGVHTPEFEFEKKYENVVAATERFGINYPVVLDNDYATWQAYRNRYWPRKYLIDIDGYIVYDHIGEGGYMETERKIRELLEERSVRLGIDSNVAGTLVSERIGEKPVSNMPRTPEIYFGAFRNSSLGNGISGKVGLQTFTLPTRLVTDKLYLVGDFDLTGEFAENIKSNSQIVLPYRGETVFMVARADTPVTAHIFIDGSSIPKDMRGTDVGEDGTVTIEKDRLYNIVRSSMWGTHTLTITIESPGLEAFTFTFG